MNRGSLADALEGAHREIDEAIERFVAQPSSTAGRAAIAAAVGMLRHHIYFEEECLFPALRADGSDALVAPILVMLREHAQIWHALDDLERAVDAAGADVRSVCHRLLVQLQHHNMKEERILYPEADLALPEAAVERLTGVLESEGLPDGWICIRARR